MRPPQPRSSPPSFDWQLAMSCKSQPGQRILEGNRARVESERLRRELKHHTRSSAVSIQILTLTRHPGRTWTKPMLKRSAATASCSSPYFQVDLEGRLEKGSASRTTRTLSASTMVVAMLPRAVANSDDSFPKPACTTSSTPTRTASTAASAPRACSSARAAASPTASRATPLRAGRESRKDGCCSLQTECVRGEWNREATAWSPRGVQTG